jgi:hypothetical protein
MTPPTASARNHTIITGPKTVPIFPAPRDCTKNSATRITTVIGTTNACAALVATPIPSTAESTEIAGVITPSPNTIPAAKSSISATNVSDAGIPTRLVGRSCASSASVPPSPSLSARSITVAYFTQTTRIMPSTCSGVGAKPRPVVKHCLNA